jgi:hypothetical protein
MKINIKIKLFIFSTILILSPILCNAQTENKYPTNFATVADMIKELGDYNEEKGTFKIISLNPLHVQLSPTIFAGENKEKINSEMQRTLIYGVYRTFALTQENQIMITVIPKEFGKSINPKYMSEYKMSVSTSKNNALKVAKKYLNISSFADLITEVKINNDSIPYQFTKDFNNIYNNDSNAKVNRNKFVSELSKK